MRQQEIEKFIINLENVEHEENMGYIFFFVGDYRMVPFATIGYADNVGDSLSNLDREGIFRVNIGISKKTFDSLFPTYSAMDTFDYTSLNNFMPHPHYGAQSYICILNPSDENEESVKRYITEAYSIAKQLNEVRKK